MINWSLVGCGDIANKRVAPAIKSQPDSRLLAVMSPYKQEIEEFSEKFNITRKYLKMEDMLNDKDIDAVYIAAPVFLHYELALKVLQGGKNVLVEKPMAMTNKQCEELIEEAEKQNVKLGVAYYRRFFPKMKEIKRLIKDGVIGDIVQVRILYHNWTNPDRSNPKAWRIEKNKAGGGPLWDIGSHKIDMMVDLAGMPKSVCSIMDTLTHDYEVEDSCSVVMKLENGAHCLASFNWNSKVWADEFEILGTEGKIKLIPCDSENIEIQLPPRVSKSLGKESTQVMFFNHKNVHYPLVEDFACALSEGRNPVVTGKEGLKTNKIIAAMEESSRNGKEIKL